MTLREKTIGFHICTPCTLNCRLCATNTPLFKQAGVNYFISPETYRRELDELFRIYDFIGNLSFTGGEPLLHKNLADLVDYAFQNYSSKFDTLRISTNGTLLPSEELLQVVREKSDGKFLVVIDDYGAISTRVQELVETLEKAYIPHRVNCYHGNDQHCGGWADLGALDLKRAYSEKDAQEIIRHCHLGTWKCLDCFEGKLYLCARAAVGVYFHCFDLKPDEYIDLFDDSVPLMEKKKIAAGFGTKAVQACYYCNGFDVEHCQRFPAGEQLGGS